MSSSRNRAHRSPEADAPWELLIGTITSPQGLAGEVRVYPQTDFPERFAELQEIGLRRGDRVEVVRITRARTRGRLIILALDGVTTREQAEALRGVELVIPRAWAMPLAPDEYYHHQLIGLEVVTTAGESLGRIEAIHATGANDVYETREALIPAVKAFIREVDLAQGRMLVEAQPGLKKSEK